MTGDFFGWVVAALLLVALIVVLVAVRGRRDTDRPAPDVVSGLMAELRKREAEAEHWRGEAERLRRQLDERA